MPNIGDSEFLFISKPTILILAGHPGPYYAAPWKSGSSGSNTHDDVHETHWAVITFICLLPMSLMSYAQQQRDYSRKNFLNANSIKFQILNIFWHDCKIF